MNSDLWGGTEEVDPGTAGGLVGCALVTEVPSQVPEGQGSVGGHHWLGLDVPHVVGAVWGWHLTPSHRPPCVQTDHVQITNIRTVEIQPPQDRKQKSLSGGIQLEIFPLSTHNFGKLISIFQFNKVWLNDHEFERSNGSDQNTNNIMSNRITAISNTDIVITLTNMINLWFTAIRWIKDSERT